MTTVEQFEGDMWPDPGPDATYVITRCTELRRKPISDFTVEDLRIMLSQRVGVPALLPRAVQVLHQDLLAEGDFYPGDLFAAVLKLPETAWEGLQTERARLQSVVADFSPEGQGDDLRSLLRSGGVPPLGGQDDGGVGASFGDPGQTQDGLRSGRKQCPTSGQ